MCTQNLPKAAIRPLELVMLKKGKKVNVMVGELTDHIVAVGGVSVSLLSYYSGFARKQLQDSDRATLLIKKGKFTTLRWICQYMSAGEEDVKLNPKLEHLHIPDLCELYELAQYLEYPSLATRVENLVRYRAGHGLRGKTEIQKIYEVFPAMSKLVIPEIVRVTLLPMVFNYEQYMELASENEALEADLEQTIKVSLYDKIRRSQAYYARGQAQYVTTKKFQERKGAQSKFDTRTCHGCGQRGHILRNCPSKQIQKWTPEFVQVRSNGEGLRTCDREVKRGEYTRTGLRI